MPKNYRGGPQQASPGRGGGRGGPRGGGRGRGRGRGYQPRGRGGQFVDDERIDVVIQRWPEENNQYSSHNLGRGRAPNLGTPASNSPSGRGARTPNTRGSQTPRGTPRSNTPRGRGKAVAEPAPYESPFARGGKRWAGRSKSNMQTTAPLSQLLYGERPLLKPIIFVKSTLTPTLFTSEEEILKKGIEDIDEQEQSHVPTADRVSRVFSHHPGHPHQPHREDSGAEEVEEIDFHDMVNLVDRLRAAPTQALPAEQEFTGFYVDVHPTPHHSNPPPPEQAHTAEPSMTEEAMTSQDGIQTQSTTDASASELITGVSHALDGSRHFPEEVAQSEMAKLDSAASSTSYEVSGFYVDTQPSNPANNPPIHPQTHKILEIHPFASTPRDDAIAFGMQDDMDPLGLPDDDVIVYVAPHPRSGKSTPKKPVAEGVSSHASLQFQSVLTGLHEPFPSSPLISRLAQEEPATLPTPNLARLQLSADTILLSLPDPATSAQLSSHSAAPISLGTPRNLKKRAMKARKGQQRAKARERGGGFSSFGVRMSEAVLRGRDPRWEERRRGDSDIDWGDDDASGGQSDADDGVAKDGGMTIDPDLDPDSITRTLAGMANRMAGDDSERFTTMDVIDDENIMRQEDEDEEAPSDSEEGSSSSDDDGDNDEELDAVVDAEEADMIGESDDDSDDASDDDGTIDEEIAGGTSFQARLERLRIQSTGKTRAQKEDNDASFEDEEDDLIAGIENILEANRDILEGRHGKSKNQLFKAVHDGSFELDDFDELGLEDAEDMEGYLFPAKRGKQRRSDLSDALQYQWDKDREKKAERKRLREQARLLAASDPLVPKKGGKKGRKASRAAALLDPEDPISTELAPNRVMSMLTLSQQIRRFLADLGGRNQMVLPAMDKATRKDVHEMANAFGLKSVSKGKGSRRYTTLLKTTRSGIRIDEAKIAKLARRGGGWSGPPRGDGKGKGKAPIRPKEGDEVGREAPKIGEANIGFQMLALMGWSDGDSIGASGGLDAPLTAIIKTTKLGLGATR